MSERDRRTIESVKGRSSSRLRALVDALQDMVFTTDADGRFTSVEGKAFHEAGLKEKDFLGRTPMEVNDPQSRAHHERAIAELKAGRSVRYEWRQGTTVYQTSATPEFASDGTIAGFVAIRSDVTELREHERALSYRHRALFEGSPVVMLLINADTGDIVDANPAALAFYGYDHREIASMRIKDINTLGETQIRAEMARARAASCAYFEFRHRLADGRVRDVEVYSGPIDFEGRKLLYSIVHDVTDHKRAEAALRLRSAALEAAANGVVITDAAGHIVFANRSTERMTGYSADELLGRNPSVLKSGRQERSYYEDLWRTITAGDVWHGDLENRRKDGSLYTEAMSISSVKDEDGAITHFVAIKQDVTEKRETARALTESEAKFRLLAENANDLIFRYRLGHEPGFDYVSPSATAMTGYTPEEHYADPELGLKLVHPDDLGRLSELTSVETPTMSTVRWIRKDGSVFWTEQHVKPVIGPDGTTIAIEGIARDVTERVAADERRRLLESMVESVRDGVLIARPPPGWKGGSFEYANPALLSMFGYDAEAFRALDPADLTGPETDPFEIQRLEHQMVAGEDVAGQLVLYAKDGTRIDVELDATPIRDARDELAYYAINVRDVTQTRAHEARLQRFRDFQRRMNLLADETLSGPLDRGFLEKVLEYGVDVVQGADAGTILVANERGDFDFVAVHNFGHDVLHASLPREVALDGIDDSEPIIVTGFRPDGLSHDTAEILFGPAGRSSEIAASLKVPIWLDGEPRALFCIDSFRDADAFLDHDTIEMGRLLGRQVGAILQRIDLQAILERHATTDPLTDLPNRAQIERVVAASIRSARQSEGVGLVMLLDVDDFKRVNDAYGHAAGDRLLRNLSDRLRKLCPADVTVGRWSGDEFVLVIPPRSLTDGHFNAERVLRAFREPFEVSGHTLHTTATLGIVAFPTHARDAREALRHAHIALHEAKRKDKSTFAYYTASMGADALRRLQLEHALREAVAMDEIEVHYQPRIDLKTGRITAAEALARWTHPDLGRVPPAEFIAVAEESGLIHELGARVLDRACKQARAWLDEGTPRIVAVNLSLKQLQSAGLVDRIVSALQTHGLSPRWLEFEITESAAMTDAARTIQVLGRLRDFGIQLSIDDFGTAYSSLAHLRLLPVDALKIDRSFVQNLAEDPTQTPVEASIVQAIISLGKSMNLRIIAEGVETVHQRAFLLLLGCHEAQGYLWGRPAPADEIPTDRPISAGPEVPNRPVSDRA